MKRLKNKYSFIHSMKRFLLFSLLLNVLLIAGVSYAVNRIGGWKYALNRLRHSESGLYSHRKSLFERMPDRPGAVVFLGDSQMEQGEWQEIFSPIPNVLNRGISGDNVNGVWERLNEVMRHKPQKVFLLVGVNDLFRDKAPAEIETRYREIVQRIRREQPDGQLVLMSVLPVNKEIRSLSADNTDVQALNGRIAQIAKEFALPYVDLYGQLTDATGNLSVQFTSDGIHLNGLGYMVMKKQLEPFLR